MTEAVPIAVIGAGASGCMAAIAAARMRPHSVLLIEKEARVGRKLLATGNGRCNLLNMRVSKRNYHGDGAHIAASLLQRYPPRALIERFASLGLACREEAEGRVYPFSGHAGSVLDVLRSGCRRHGVRVRTDAPVVGVDPLGNGRFRIAFASGDLVDAGCVIVAGGGMASASLGSDGSALTLLERLGHETIPLFPAIVPLKLPPEQVRGLKGVRAPVELALLRREKLIRAEVGEALFTEDGISGIAAMQLARAAQQALRSGEAPMLRISLMPEQDALREVASRASLFCDQPVEDAFAGLLHPRLTACMLRNSGLQGARVSHATMRSLAGFLSDWRMPVIGTRSFAHAQVTAGGTSTAAFDAGTLASYIMPGLFACGEVLDVDGDCGGYNLMWAWVSGIVAGEAAALAAQIAHDQ